METEFFTPRNYATNISLPRFTAAPQFPPFDQHVVSHFPSRALQYRSLTSKKCVGLDEGRRERKSPFLPHPSLAFPPALRGGKKRERERARGVGERRERGKLRERLDGKSGLIFAK